MQYDNEVFWNYITALFFMLPHIKPTTAKESPDGRDHTEWNRHVGIIRNRIKRLSLCYKRSRNIVRRTEIKVYYYDMDYGS